MQEISSVLTSHVCTLPSGSHFYKAGKVTHTLMLKSSAGCKSQQTAASEFLSMFSYIQLFFIVATTLFVVRFI